MTEPQEREPQEREPQDVQERLPLEVSPEGGGGPIRFELTAKARRAVAPHSLPDLSVVEPDGTTEGSEEPDDTHRARARALRRAGLGWEAIAEELGVDALLVRAWVDGVAPVHSARRRARASRRGDTSDRATGGAGASDGPFAVARAEARSEAPGRLDAGTGFGAGLGLVVGSAEISGHAVTVSTADPDVAAGVLAWLRSATGFEDERLRVVLRVGSAVAGDRAVRRWAAALDVPVERITTTRWTAAPSTDATAALIRIADPRFAGTLAGWRDVLLERLGVAVDPEPDESSHGPAAPALGA